MRLCYLHLPRFPLQRKVREQPALAGRPLVAVEESQGSRRVAFASTSALRAGVRVGLGLTAAKAVAPELVCFAHQPAVERAALVSLGEALLSLAPGFCLAAPDGLWLDASAASLWGGDEALAARAIALCRDQGYLAQAAVASQRFTARALARHGTGRLQVVAPSQSAAALAPLPLKALEEPSAQEPFGSLGLSTLGEVAALPPGAILARLGAVGRWAQRRCRGEDDTLFVAEPLPEALVEELALDWPAEALEPLLFALKTAFDRLCARLWGRQRAAVRLTLTLKLEPAGQVALPLTLARPSAQVRLLLELARLRLESLTLERPIAALAVQVDEACEDHAQQLVLGDAPAPDAPLEGVLSRLATALGESALFSADLADRHRPEGAYRACAFHPPAASSGFGRAGLPLGSPPPADAAPAARPCRFLSKAAEVAAEVGDGGELVAARLWGKRRKATSVAGPERLCGEWWEDAFARDYYRVHFEGLGPVWLYRDARDGRFYLHGMFD